MSGLRKFKPVTIFGKRLYEIKQKRKLSCKKIADDAGVTLAAVSRWLTSYSFPSCQSIVLISKAYDVSADYLLGLSDRRNYKELETLIKALEQEHRTLIELQKGKV